MMNTRVEMNEEMMEQVSGGKFTRISGAAGSYDNKPKEPDWHGPADVQRGGVNWKGWHGPAND